MSKPKCPKCDSTNVVASLAKNSHDNCVSCGYSGFVREFYEPEFRTVKARDPIAEERPRPDPEPVASFLKRKPFPKAERHVEGNPRQPYWWERD